MNGKKTCPGGTTDSDHPTPIKRRLIGTTFYTDKHIGSVTVPPDPPANGAP